MDHPVSKSPVNDPPATQSPVMEAPVTQSPFMEAPVADSPPVPESPLVAKSGADSVNTLYTKLVLAISGTLFGITGSIFLIYSGPIFIIVFLAIIYIKISGVEDIQNVSVTQISKTNVQQHQNSRRSFHGFSVPCLQLTVQKVAMGHTLIA